MSSPRPLCAGALVLLSACNVQTCFSQLTSQQLMVGTLLATPPVTFDPAAIAGLDAGTLDGGWTLPSETAAYVFFGQRSNTTLDQPPTPITDAVVSVGPASGSTTTLTNSGQGNYTGDSVQAPSLQYQSGATYDFTATEGGNAYVGEVSQVPQVEVIPDLPTPPAHLSFPAGTAYSFNRPDPPTGQERNVGFVEVFPVDSSGQRGNPTYTNIPQTPLDFLKLVAAPSDWKQTTVEIPGTAFPNAKSTYVIVFESVKNGGPKSSNLFTGSALLAGTADVSLVLTQ